MSAQAALTRYALTELQASNGYKAAKKANSPAAFKTTHIGKCEAALTELVASYEPPPPPAVDNSLAQSWLILAENPEYALESPRYYRLAVTADQAYRHFFTAPFLNAARAQGRTVYSWSDCDQTPPATAIEMARANNLDGWLGQGETAEQFDNAYAAGAKVAVVNLSVLRQDQLALILTRKVLAVVELYRNCQPWQKPDWRNVNPGVGGNCVAFYRDAQCPGMSLEQYVADGMFVPRRDSVYGAQMTPDDYRKLP